MSTITLVKNGANISKRKYINVHYHHIPDIVERGEIKVDYISFEKMLVDPMTKELSLERLLEHVMKMGLRV